jgi:hypothetical protein
MTIATFGTEFGTGQVFWSLVWFFLFAVLLYFVITILIDIFGSDDLGGWGKAGWALVVLLLPFIGIVIYLIARGDDMHERQAPSTSSHDEAMSMYLRGPGGAVGGPDPHR